MHCRAYVENEAAERARLATVGRFGRRRARNDHQAATNRTRTLRGQVSSEWGTTPTSTDRLSKWAVKFAAKRAETDPRVTDAVQAIDAATTDHEAMRKRHEQEHLTLLVDEHGAERVRYDRVGVLMIKPHRKADGARTRAALIRAEADELRTLPIAEAAQRIETKNAEREHRRQEAVGRERQLPDPFEYDPHRHDSGRDGPSRGL